MDRQNYLCSAAAVFAVFAAAAWGIRDWSLAHELPFTESTARQQTFITPRNPTYRMLLDYNTVIGVSMEIQNPAGSGKKLVFRRFRAYLSAANTAYIRRTTTTATGGTATTPAVVKLASDSPASVATLKQFTAAPTPGTVDQTLDRLQVGASGNVAEDPLPSDREAMTIRPGENLVMDCSAAITLAGYIEWVEMAA